MGRSKHVRWFRGVVAAAGLTLLAGSAWSAVYLANLMPAHLIVRGILVAAFNNCVSEGVGLAEGEARSDFLEACCGAVEFECSQVCEGLYEAPAFQEACKTGCNDAEYHCGNLTMISSDPGSEMAYDDPVHPTLFPERRIDFCREPSPSGGVSCGAPAAHAFCELELGTGYLANAFQPDGVAASINAPTWKLGLDPISLADDEQCETASCQGFDFIQCVDATIPTPCPPASPSAWTSATWSAANAASPPPTPTASSRTASAPRR